MPDLSKPYTLTPESAESFKRDGHVLLRGVCSREEIAAFREIIVDCVRRHNEESRPMADRDTYGKAFLQTMNLWEVCDDVKEFTFANRFAKLAADLMGVDSVRLYHDQALFKEASGGHTPWHQDQYYWPLGTDNTITMWMPLVDATEDMGTMTLASGSQRAGFLGHIGISDESEERFRALVTEKGYPLTSCGAMKAGDASFHSGWTLHSAPANKTPVTREAMTIIYFADGARLLTPDNENRQADLERWHPGQSPGELAASPINPVVYTRSK
jgi:ectoine hydroxylase-related dioxygenase (phytanoyl-CoA dioxygenase family)